MHVPVKLGAYTEGSMFDLHILCYPCQNNECLIYRDTHKAMNKRTQFTNKCMSSYSIKNYTMNATYTIFLATYQANI